MSFDLTTQFGSLELKSPIIVGSCPMTAQELQRIAMVSNGAGAIAMPSLFEEHFSNTAARPEQNLDDYLRLVEQASQQLSIPVIASISGGSSTPWENVVAKIESAGAHAIEFSFRQSNPRVYRGPREIEDSIVESAKRINDLVSIPLIVKLTRNYTSIGDLGRQLNNYVQGLVLFGRAPVIDIELDSLKLSSSWGLTQPGSIVQSLESIMGVRANCPELPLAACGGIDTSIDLIKALLAGANAAMITSSIYRNGASAIGSMIEGLKCYMERHEMNSMAELARRNLASSQDAGNHCSYEELVLASQDRAMATDSPTFECDRWGHPRSSK